MGKFGQNWHKLVTEIEQFVENVCSILHINLFERYDQYEKKFHQQNNFSFSFFVSIPNFV